MLRARIQRGVDLGVAWGCRCRYASGILAYEDCSTSDAGEGSPTALVLHGLLGQGKNWRTMARRLGREAEAVAGRPWRVLCLDLRCHGASSRVARLDPPHTMASSAQDILRFVRHELRGHWPEIVLGHSMGGKVALEYVQQAAATDDARLPRHVWSLDSQPGFVAPELVPDIARVLKAVRDTPLPVSTRAALSERLRGQGFSEGLVQWLGSNLVPASPDAPAGDLVWAFDPAGAEALYTSYRETCYWPLLGRPPRGVEIHVLRAGASDRWDADMVSRLDGCAEGARARHDEGTAGKTTLHELAGSGHWVHVDKPDSLAQLLLESFRGVARHLHDPAS